MRFRRRSHALVASAMVLLVSAVAAADPPASGVVRSDDAIAALQSVYDREHREDDLLRLSRAELADGRWLDAWHHQQALLAAHTNDRAAPWSEVRDEQRQAETHLGRLVIETDPPGVLVAVDGAAVGRAPVDVRALPGGHVLRFEEDGRWIATRRVTAVAGETTEVSYALPVLPRVVAPSATTEYVLLGVGAGLLGVAAYGAARMVNNPHSALRDGTCINDCDSLGTSMLILGVLIGLPVACMGVYGLWHGHDPPRRPHPIRASAGPGTLGIGVTYAF